MVMFDVLDCAKKEEVEKEDNEEPMEDLLKPGHLTRLLDEEVATEVEALCVGDVVGGLVRLLGHLRTHRDLCEPKHFQVLSAVALTNGVHHGQDAFTISQSKKILINSNNTIFVSYQLTADKAACNQIKFQICSFTTAISTFLKVW